MFRLSGLISSENNKVQNRNIGIDCLKAIAMIAVVLYHMGLFKDGYLGVDLFLVISGYLTAKSIMNSLDKNTFSYFKFLTGRIIRLMPIVLFATSTCFVIGYFIMLPDDFENLCETIFATNLFANNILQCITTKNYWDVVNEYKPLMHTWYLGIIVQSYLFVPWIFMIAKRIDAGKYKKIAFYISLMVFMVSFVIYLLPFFSAAEKFYCLPFRLFEIMMGMVLACALEIKFSCTNDNNKQLRIISAASFLSVAVLLMFFHAGVNIKLILCCILGVIVLCYIAMCCNKIIRGGYSYFWPALGGALLASTYGIKY